MLSLVDNMDMVTDETSGPSDNQASAPAAVESNSEGITVLVVDDERSNVESLEKIFFKENMRVLSAHDAKHALEELRKHRVHVLLTDLMMPGTTGLELLRAVKQVRPEVEVVLMTAYGSVEAAVSAMREGAYDFVEKPLKRMTIVKSVRKAAERGRLLEENRSLKDEIKMLTKREIIGSSVAWTAAQGHAGGLGGAAQLLAEDDQAPVLHGAQAADQGQQCRLARP
jgi:two-component system response regulator HydG